MQRYRLISVLLAGVVLFSGCSTGTKKADEAALPKEDHATEITIEIQDYGDNFYANAAKKFEAETGVKVNVINDYKPGQPIENLTATTDRIQAELMAGKGADLYANIYLDYISIGKNKHLCNLANWITKEPLFSDDTYYMNILKSGIVEGDAYSIPLFMFFSAMGSNIEVPELDGKSLNWEEFFEFTKGLKRNGAVYGITDRELFYRRYTERYDHFIVQKKKKQNLNSPEMVKLLEQCKEWSTKGLCISGNAENYTDLWDKAFFKDSGGGDMYILVNFRYDNPNLKTQFYFYNMPSDSGKNDKANEIATSDRICINAASPYKATAWKFIKFLLRKDIQMSAFGTPINRRAADEHVKKRLKDQIDYFGLDVDANKIIKESEAILDAVDKVSTQIFPDEIDKIIIEEGKRFFKNEISAEDAAKNMANKVELYFKEQ